MRKTPANDNKIFQLSINSGSYNGLQGGISYIIYYKKMARFEFIKIKVKEKKMMGDFIKIKAKEPLKKGDLIDIHGYKAIPMKDVTNNFKTKNDKK